MNHTELRASLDADERIISGDPGVLREASLRVQPMLAYLMIRLPDRNRQLREALDEIERLKAAGEVLAAAARGEYGDAFDAECRVFEEGANASE